MEIERNNKSSLSQFEQELLTLIIETCERDPKLADSVFQTSYLIGPESPLGLDSLDAVEIVSLVQVNYGVRIASQETSRDVLQSIQSLAEYIQSNKE